ncbi:unknown protein [Leptolyngbya sp. NIES-3755]|nr:unknown protein [Leptolyngbya sp. NIES-3755]
MTAKEKIINELAEMPDDLADEILRFLLSVKARQTQSTELDRPTQKRKAGVMKGTFVLPLTDDFDEPLEDFKEYME